MTQPEFKISINPIEEAASYISDVLKERLSNSKKVLWLVPGGSAIAVSVRVAEMLKDIDCSNLIISLTDERYGDVGHSDSSFGQSISAGFEVNDATIYPVLNGENIEETVKGYNEFLNKYINEVDYAIGLFGIGADGHTAGILPGSVAVLSTDFACGYQGGKYYRITVTPEFISRLDEVVVYAVGESKKEILKDIKSEHDLISQPAQSLKQAGKFIIIKD